MRLLIIAALLATLPWAASAAPTWQTISSEPGKRIELDRTSIKREDGDKVQAQGRVILEKEIIDSKSGSGYRIIEAITRYNCGTRSANTIKRIYRKSESEILREEDIKGSELPVRTGTLDDKVLREVCRPPKEGAGEIAQKANEAASQLKQANETLLKKEMAKPEKPGAPIKTSDTPPPAAGGKVEGVVPSIRPNLKAAMEATKDATQAPAPVHTATPTPTPIAVKETPAAAHKEAPPAHKEAPPPHKETPQHVSKPTTVVVHTKAAGKPARPPRQEGYMLELAHSEPAMQHAHIHWSYEGEGGPDNWAKLDPNNKACASGQRQSPIDIQDGIKVDLEPIKFSYRPSNFRIVDNGHTIQVNVGDSSIMVTGKSYELVQFHFHRPSEEKVNGQRFDMVVHLVHKADDGQLAVVAVLLERGNENPFIQTLWNNLPLEKNVSITPPEMVIDPATLLPSGRNYYTYMGSLTTPPCTEGVLWLVLKQPVQVSTEQINIFSRFYRNNARPVQARSGRTIKEGR